MEIGKIFGCSYIIKGKAMKTSFLDFFAITNAKNGIHLISKAKINILGNSTSWKYIWKRGYR